MNRNTTLIEQTNLTHLQVLSLHVLESKGWTNKFFSLWFSSIDNFTRVHDKKLSIAAIVALLTLNADQVPVSVQQGWPRLLQGIVRLFQTLPAATKSKCLALPELEICTDPCSRSWRSPQGWFPARGFCIRRWGWRRRVGRRWHRLEWWDRTRWRDRCQRWTKCLSRVPERRGE